MQHVARFKKLMKELSATGLDAIFLGPSTDTQYMAELTLFDDERVKGLMISASGECFAMTPLLYEEEMRRVLGSSVSFQIWADHEGFAPAFKAGCDLLGLEHKRIAINDGVRAVDLIDMKLAVDAEYVNGANTLAPLRRRKDEDELNRMRAASAITDTVLEELSRFIRKGMTEKDVQDKLLSLYTENGAQGLAFSPIVASGPGGSMPHYTGNDRVLRDGDFVVIDTGCRYEGYCSDSTRTFCVGEPDDEMRKIYGIVLEAQKAGEAAVVKGATGQDVDRAARKIISDAGYGSCFLNRLGHGIGLAVHESPYIIEGNDVPLEPGNVFSVEPGIYIPGKYGVRIENLVAVRPDGTGEALNKFTRDLITAG